MSVVPCSEHRAVIATTSSTCAASKRRSHIPPNLISRAGTFLKLLVWPTRKAMMTTKTHTRTSKIWLVNPSVCKTQATKLSLSKTRLKLTNRKPRRFTALSKVSLRRADLMFILVSHTRMILHVYVNQGKSVKQSFILRIFTISLSAHSSLVIVDRFAVLQQDGDFRHLRHWQPDP